jgi:hypothetical protein
MENRCIIISFKIFCLTQKPLFGAIVLPEGAGELVAKIISAFSLLKQRILPSVQELGQWPGGTDEVIGVRAVRLCLARPLRLFQYRKKKGLRRRPVLAMEDDL